MAQAKKSTSGVTVVDPTDEKAVEKAQEAQREVVEEQQREKQERRQQAIEEASSVEARTPSDEEVAGNVRTSIENVFLGNFVRVTEGDHENKYAVVEELYDFGKDGVPSYARLVTRDDEHRQIVVDFDSLERAEAGHR